jgi:hypothetical protein
MEIIIFTAQEFDSIELLGTKDVTCTFSKLELRDKIEENCYRNIQSFIIFHHCESFPLPEYCKVFDDNGLLCYLYGKTNSLNFFDCVKCSRLTHLQYISYDNSLILDELHNFGYDCLLKNITFAIHYRDVKFRAIFWLWCENYPDFVIRLFCNFGFVLHVQNLQFALKLDKLRRLLEERHFHQAMNHICALVANYEFCVNLTNPVFFNVFEMLNQLYPLGDLVSIFTTKGFCNHIVNPIFYLHFKKCMSITKMDIISLFSSPGFISHLLNLGYFDHVLQIYNQFKTYKLFTCQSFCFQSQSTEFKRKMDELQLIFGIEQTCQLLMSESISKNLQSLDFFKIVNKVISTFGHLHDSCKLLCKSYDQIQSYNHFHSWIAIFGSRKASKLLRNPYFFSIQNFIRMEEFVKLLNLNNVYRLLKDSIGFIYRIEDDVFFDQVSFLSGHHSIETVVSLLMTTHICVRIENPEFSNELHQLLLSIGDYNGCQFVCHEQFEHRMKDWKLLHGLLIQLPQIDVQFLFTCSTFRIKMLYGNFEEVLNNRGSGSDNGAPHYFLKEIKKT